MPLLRIYISAPLIYPKAKANFLWLISRLTQERAWI
jgi:hypothetical protein